MKQSKVRRTKETQVRPRRRQPAALPDEQLRVTLYSVGDAVIVTDTQGRVTMMNPVAEALTGWNEADALGKPLAQIFHIINEETRTVVENPVARVLRDGVVIGLANHTLLIARDGREIPIADSGAPIRDARGEIAGVVLVFRDQTKERQAQRLVQEARDFAESIVATVREPLVVLDAHLRVISANRAFYRTFQVTPAETDGHPIYELGNRQWDIPELRALLEKILPQNSHFDDFVVEHEFEQIGKRTMLLNARRIRHDPNQTQMILLAIEDISDRQRAEDALRESEERYRTFIQQANDYIFTLNPNGQITSANQIMCQDLGYTEEELLGKSALDLVTPEKREEAAQALHRIWSGESVGQFEVPIQTRDGETIFVQIRGRSIYKDGKFVETLHIARNITDRKRAEDALRESEERFRTLAETTATAIFVYSGDKFIYGNYAAQKLTGYSAKELFAMRFWDVVHPEFREMIRQRGLARQRGEEIPARYEFKIVRKDGEERWVDFTAGRIEWRGQPAVIGSAFDITERKQVEEALRKSEERYRHISEMISDYVYAFRVDADGTLHGEWITDSFLHVFGYTLREVDKRGGWLSMVHPADSSIALQHTQHVISGKLDVCEMRFVTRAGEVRWLRDYAIPVWDAQQNRVIRIYGAAQDITERKQAEDALRESEERFRRLAENAQDLIYRYEFTPTRGFTYVSPSAIIITGYTPEDHYADPDLGLKIVHPDDRPLLEQYFQNSGVFNEPIVLRWIRKDGQIIWTEQRNVPIFDAQGNLIAIEGIARDITERKRHERELEAEALIAQALSENLTLASLLERLLNAARHALPAADKGSILFADAQGNLRIHALVGYTDPRVATAIFPQSHGYSARAYRERRALIIPDARADPTICYDGEITEMATIQSAIVAPLLVQDRVIGVIALDNAHQPAAFNDHDLRILTNIASTVALAIERARLFEETRRRAEQEARLNQLGRALAATLDLKTIYRTTHTHLQALVDCPNFAISLFDPIAQTIRVDYVRTNGDEPDPSLLPPLKFDPNARAGRSLAIASQTPVIVDDLSAKSRAGGVIIVGDERLPDSAIYVPMIVEGKVLGLLELQSYQPRAYSLEDANLLGTAANQIGLAIQNARLFDDLRIRLTELETLHTIASLCIQATDENSLIEQITNVISNNLYPDNIGFLLMNAEGTHLLPHPSHRGITIENSLAQIPLNAGIAGRVAASGKPYRTGDVRLEDAYIEINPATRSELCVPLIVGGRVIGVINVESHKLNAFSETDERLLTTAASQVATALERLRLLNEMRQRLAELEMLQTVSAALRQAHTLEEMIPLFVRYAIQAVQARVGTIYLREDASGDWVSYGWVNAQGEWVTCSELRHRPGEGITGRVGATGEIYVTADWRTDPINIIQPGEQTLLNELCSGISLPLHAERHTTGVMHLWYAQARTFTEAEKRLLTAIADMAGNALQRVRLFEETRRRLNELNTLHQASQTLLVFELEPEATYTAIHRAIAQTMPCQALSIVLEDQALGDYHGVYLYDKSGRVPAQRVPRGKGLSGYVISTGKTLLIDDYAAQTEISALHFGDPEHVRSILAVPLRRGAQTIGMVATQAYPPHAFTQEHRVLLETLAAQFATSIENAHLYEQTRLRLRELEVVSTVSAALRTAPTQSEMFPVILDQLIHLLDVDGAAIEMLEPATDDLITKLGRGVWASLTGDRIPAGKGLSAQVLATGEPYLNNDARNDPHLFHPDAFGDCRAAAGVPLRVKTQTLGLLWLASRRTLTEHDLRLLTAIADIAANAIHRAALNEQTERHLSQLATLHAIDRAISSNFDLRLTLNLLLEHVTTQLDVDAASVLLLNPQTQVLEYAASCGFRTRAIEQTRLRIGESFAGRAALERQSVHVPDLAARAEEFTVKGLVAENYAEYYGVPLIARGNVVGVMEIFHRTPLPSDKEWFDFCAMLAGQAALAIDNARLFSDLQQANAELACAYDATIEGWSRALDLRDKETEGHTQRVTEMTLEMARVLGIGEEEIVHIRRGALLHDIGKMGVSDNILLKPGKLTEAERAIMREHPRHAYELLLPIEYLRPALDIPYCHHEKWDGTGYPRGLKGEDIPLVARIFAVVDVYDALTSDRPYRKAWRREDVFEYIRQQAGKHFDPRIVEIFLKMFGT